MIRMASKTVVASALIGFVASCAGPSGSGGDELPGKVVVALTGVPADVSCVQITAAGSRTVTRAFPAAAGANAMLAMPGLPLGQVTFTAQAFDVGCPAVNADLVPTWISDAPFVATVAIKPPALVTLNLVHNGNATVSVGFDDSADGGGTAGSSGSGAGGSSAGGEFMKVPNAMGGSTVKGFENWFVLESFNLGLTTAVDLTSGTGSGAGKTAWTVTASLRFQNGVAALYADVATGTHLSEVDFAFEKGGAMPFVYWQAKLKNAIVTSIASEAAHGTELPLLTVTFAFQQIELEYDPRKPDGSADATVVIDWDLAKNEGASPTISELDFAYRGPGPVGFEALTAFRAPSETVATDPLGGGGGVGKPVFGDASATLAIDGTVLSMVLDEASGRAIPTAKVEIFDNEATGAPEVFGTYGFQNVLITSMTLTGNLDATATWTSEKLSWTVGGQTGTAGGPTP